MNSNELLLCNAFKEFNIELNDIDVSRFLNYKNLLLNWNEKFNLTAITDEEEIIVKHFADSVSCLITNVFSSDSKIIDVGTGAGFPGIPIKLVIQDVKLTLLDSLNKRVVFLNEVIKELNLKDTVAIHGRAEDLGVNKEHREVYDIAVSRAVASLSVLAEYSLPFVKQGGFFISMKGPNVEQELDVARKAIAVLGGQIEDVVKVSMPSYDYMHSIIVIKKVMQCPTKYPRKAGKPTKDPIR